MSSSHNHLFPQFIEKLSKLQLSRLLELLDFEIDAYEDLDEKEMKGLLRIHAGLFPQFDRVLELSSCFEYQPLDIVNVLLESNSFRLTKDLIQQMNDLCDTPINLNIITVSRHSGLVDAPREVVASAFHLLIAEPSKEQDADSIVRWTGELPPLNAIDTEGSAIECFYFTNEADGATSALHVGPKCGILDLEILLRRIIDDQQTGSKIVERCIVRLDIAVISPSYVYCIALDSMLDAFYWGWQTWTSDLEESLLELLVSVNEELSVVIGRFKSIMVGMPLLSYGSGEERNGKYTNEIEELFETVTCDLSAALCDRSAYAVGRLHQTLTQFVEVASMMSIPESFHRSLNRFVLAKIASSDSDILFKSMTSLVDAASRYKAGLLQEQKTDTRGVAIEASSYPSSTSSSTSGKRNIVNQLHKLDSFLSVCSARWKVIAVHSDLGNQSIADASESTVVTHTDNTKLSWEEIVAIDQLRPKSLEAMCNASLAISQWDGVQIYYMPVISLEILMEESPAQLESVYAKLSQNMFSEVVNIGSIIGYDIRANNTALTAALISRLLNTGFCYVTSESGKLLATIASQRSMLLLQNLYDDAAIVPSLVQGWAPYLQESETAACGDCGNDRDSRGAAIAAAGVELKVFNEHRCSPTRFDLPSQLRKRIKDISRVFRTKVKAQLSLRLNSNISLAIAHLRLHHGRDCWVGPELERVWMMMASAQPPQLLVFELWYGDTMVAADFAHPSNAGTAIYVATRFFDRSDAVRQIQPGFLLALAECKVLRDAGYTVWDLGGVNMCPLMRYKWDLTGRPVERMAAMHTLELARHRQRRRQTTTRERGGENAAAAAANDDVSTSDTMGMTAAVHANATAMDAGSPVHALTAGILVADITFAHLLSAD